MSIQTLITMGKAHSRRHPKLRGNRRYFRRLRGAGSRIRPAILDGWCDFSHLHFDWSGRGNSGRKARRAHLVEFLAVMKTISREQTTLSQPAQVWVQLDGHDAGEDALFMHTPNPNRDNFPYICSRARWGLPEIEALARKLAPELSFVAGRLDWVEPECGTSRTSLLLFSPCVGHSLR